MVCVHVCIYVCVCVLFWGVCGAVRLNQVYHTHIQVLLLFYAEIIKVIRMKTKTENELNEPWI